MNDRQHRQLRMELVELLGAALPEVEASALFELAAADPEIFYTEVVTRHRSGALDVPDDLLKAVRRDLHRAHRATDSGSS